MPGCSRRARIWRSRMNWRTRSAAASPSRFSHPPAPQLAEHAPRPDPLAHYNAIGQQRRGSDGLDRPERARREGGVGVGGEEALDLRPEVRLGVTVGVAAEAVQSGRTLGHGKVGHDIEHVADAGPAGGVVEGVRRHRDPQSERVQRARPASQGPHRRRRGRGGAMPEPGASRAWPWPC